MPRPDLTHLVVLLDRSGSMANIADDMSAGCLSFLREQAKLPGACRVTLVQFDTQSTDTVHDNVPAGAVTEVRLVPRGGTPLLDAVGTTITRVGETLRDTPEAERPGRVLFVVVTDGQENSSREHRRDRVREMIRHQTDVYGWQFSYLGANVDAFAESGGLGIAAAASSGYAAAPEAARAAWAGLSASTASYRGGQAFAITDEQRVAMGGAALPDATLPDATPPEATPPNGPASGA